MGANLSESRKLAALEAELNRINQATPFGSQTFTQPTDAGGIWSSEITLSPAQQALLEQQQLAQRLMGRQGIDMARALPGAGDPLLSFGPRMAWSQALGEGSRGDVERAHFDRTMSLLNPELQRTEDRLRQRLANQGLPQASRAFESEFQRFDQGANDLRQQAALASVLAGGQEQSRMFADVLAGRQQSGNEQLLKRQVPFDEMLSLFNMTPQPTGGDFFAPGQTQVQNLSTPGSMPFGQQLLLGAVGAAGNIGSGFAMGRR